MRFTVTHTDEQSRAGVIETARGTVHTPVFMPIGTQASVKAVSPRDVRETGARMILANTYHLYLRPGVAVLEQAGGLHRFMNWDRLILTDSGGYQVFSLSDLKKISDEGVVFQSHIDGSRHLFTPESVMDTQRSIGGDVMMVLDECIHHPCEHQEADTAHRRTIAWAERCKSRFQSAEAKYGYHQTLFGIVQGSTFEDLRRESATALVEMEFDGYAIGGLSVGEPTELMYEMTSVCTEILPIDKPRYLMGVGTPENLLESIERGIDMFDCVLPTRNGRNAMLFTRNGSLSIKNAEFKTDFRPVDEECGCYTCRTFSRAYIRHLFMAREILGLHLATLHNLHFFQWLMTEARRAIIEERYKEWKLSQCTQMKSRKNPFNQPNPIEEK